MLPLPSWTKIWMADGITNMRNGFIGLVVSGWHDSVFICDCISSISGAALAFLANRRCSAEQLLTSPQWYTVNRYGAWLQW